MLRENGDNAFRVNDFCQFTSAFDVPRHGAFRMMCFASHLAKSVHPTCRMMRGVRGVYRNVDGSAEQLSHHAQLASGARENMYREAFTRRAAVVSGTLHGLLAQVSSQDEKSCAVLCGDAYMAGPDVVTRGARVSAARSARIAAPRVVVRRTALNR